ncbi:hypothetical protein [Actinomadura keratinilytica]|uniref:Uncharacterized protein n=1 Tax=Actinomadura keratinilytica TaxID=547461 RepID=A0ABP7YTD9_9ACTN
MTHRGAAAETRRVVATIVAVGAALLALFAVSSPRAHAAETSASARAAAAPTGRVAIIGIPGLTWQDVTRGGTPTLWRLTGQGAAGALSIRTTRVNTCPMDGWLTVSAGQRARLAHGDCALPSAPVTAERPGAQEGAPPEGGALAPGWQSIKDDNSRTSYHARVGLLGDAVRGAGGCTLAVGPGAVFGLADGAGRVDRYAPSPDKVPAADWSRCALIGVEIDDIFRAYLTAGVDAEGEQVPVTARARARAARAADQRVAQVLAGLPRGTTVLVAGLSDTDIKPHIRVAVAQGPTGEGGKTYQPGYLTSSATRQTALVTLTDLTATTLKVLGLPQPKEAVGSAWRTAGGGDTATMGKVDRLRDEDVAAQAIRHVQGGFWWVLGGAQLLLYGIAGVALRRRWNVPASRARILSTTRFIALVGGAVPVATFLTGMVPWWNLPHPTPALVATVLGFSVLVAVLAWAGPWRGSVLGPGLAIAALTALTLAADVMADSRLQLNTLMGYNAIIAGRFYGFGNQAFSLFAVAAILTAAWLAERPVRAGRRAAAVAIIAAVGAAAVAVDGLPAWGSDFGGVIAMVPAFAVLGLMATGQRVSALRLGLFCLLGAALVLLISYVNSRSANPTHLGRFWQDLMNGDAWDVVVRKFQAMLRSLGYWPFTLALAGAIAFLYFVLIRPLKWRASLLERLYERCATMRPALVCALTVGVVGTLVNDSGVVILSVAFSLATPLLLAAAVRALELDLAAEGTSAPQRSGSPSAAPG